MVQVPLKDYSYSNARVKAMASRLLEKGVFDDLLAAADFGRAVSILDDTDYGDDIEEAIIEGYRPTNIDRAFNRNLARDFTKIKEFFIGRPQELVNVLLSRWDLFNLKTILRGMSALVPKMEILRSLAPMGALDLVTLEEIADQPDLRAALDAIVMFSPEWWIPYGRAVAPHMAEFIRERDLSILETAMDKLHYGTVARVVRGRDSNSTLVRRVLEMEVDSINIATLVRICGLELEESRAEDYYVPGGTISAEEFIDLMSLGVPEKVAAALDKTPYAGALKKAAEGFEEKGEPVFQDELQKYVIRECLNISEDPLGIGVIVKYMWKKYLEVVNLRIIIRGKSIGLIESQIRKELYLMNEEVGAQ